MAKYSKLYSNYIFRKKHGNISDGTLFERDWVTTGERHILSPGKKPYSGNGGFLFTDNSKVESVKRHKYGKWVGHYVYDDVKDSTSLVNRVIVNYKSKDIRDFAYYGSAVELLRVSLEDIAREFPGKIDIGANVYRYFDESVADYVEISYPGGHLYEIHNPFNINMSQNDVVIGKGDNPLRFLTYSWANYVIEDFPKDDEDKKPFTITSYVSKWNGPQTEDLERYNIGGNEYIKYGCYYYRYDRETSKYRQIKFVDENNYFVRCTEYIKHLDKYYQWNSTEGCYKQLPVYEVCPTNGTPMVTISITAEYDNGIEVEEREYVVFGILINGSIVYVSPNAGITIRPKDSVIDEYFSGLEGFERMLLTRDSDPLFKNTFITPVIGGDGEISYIERVYTIPSDGYCVNMTTPAYDRFVNELSSACSLLDELWTDNIWRNMTHESIKNFDWTYSRDYEPGDEVYNVEGGIRMEKIVRIYGRLFDDIKRYVDGIKMSFRVTYDGYNNIPDAEISDKCEVLGIDMYSTMWMPYFYEEEPLENIAPDEEIVRLQSFPAFVDVDSPEIITIGCDDNPEIYYRKKTIPTSDVKITEEYVEGKDENDDFWIKKDCGWISSNNVNVDSIHSKWYSSNSCEKVTPSICDIDFVRRMFISAKHILRTKGTTNSIEMMLGMFGLGLDVDYKLTETYHHIKPKFYDDRFYWYRPFEKKPYESIEKLRSYLYRVTFSTIPDPIDVSFVIPSGCTSFVRDGKLHRNLDWNYDETNEFVIVTRDFKGMAMLPTLTDGNMDDVLISQLPYHVNDGVNEHGIMISSHVLYDDFGYTYGGNTDVTKIPYIVLTTLTSIDDINSLYPVLADIRINQTLVDNHYLMQFLVTDGTTKTYVITPSSSGYEIVDITTLPKIANFKWVNVPTLNRNNPLLQDHPTGIERWNDIENGASLEELRFSKAYESPTRLSEFIGLHGTDKNSTDQELEDIYNSAHALYTERTRNGYLWQTMHSIVYTPDGIESLNVQEDYNTDYAYDIPYVEVPDGIHFGPSNTYESIPLNVNHFSKQYIRVENELGTYDYYVKDESMTVWEAMEYINRNKGLSLVYDTPNSGIPIENVFLGKDHLVIPYFKDSLMYDGNPVFQSDGGWCKKSTSGIVYDYDETMSNMHVFTDIDAMLGVNYNDVRQGEIVYVARISEYLASNAYHGANESHFFKLVDRYFPERLESWKNIPMSGSIMYDDYIPVDEDITHIDYLMARHLDSIISINTGNNPHGGYGIYDGGKKYLEYVEMPFKYCIDNGYFSDVETESMARQMRFGLSHKITDNEKVKTILNTTEYIQVQEEDVYGVEWNEMNTFESVPSRIYGSSPLFIRVGEEGNYSYHKKTEIYAPNKKYYINSKVLYITNLLDSNLYKSYFMNVILKYVAQVVPSTTIMILDGFNICADDQTERNTLTVKVNDETMGTAQGGGTYGSCDDVAVQAFANDGFSFLHWLDENGTIVSTDERYVFRITEDVVLTAVFA